MSEINSWNDDGFYEAEFAVQKSRRYHAKFRAFYEALHNAAMLATAISSTSAFFLLLSDQPQIATYLAGVVGVASTLDFFLRWESKSRLHDGLCRRFTELAAEIQTLEANLHNLRKVKADIYRIESDEPTERRLIDIQASNEELRSRGCSEDQLYRLTWAQRRFGYVLTFGMERIEEQKALRELSARS